MLGNIGAQFIPHSVAKETGEALGFFLWESERKTGEKNVFRAREEENLLYDMD